MKISVVAPFLNESESIVLFLEDLKNLSRTTDYNFEVILVDDGSSDDSVNKIIQFGWENVIIVELIRNLGQQKAIMAGLRNASGEFVVTMDSDGQHPVHMIPIMVERIKSSDAEYIAMIRANHNHLSIIKRIGSRGYYGILRLLGLKSLVNGQADFRILRAKTVSKLVKNKKSIVRLSLSEMKSTFETVEYNEIHRSQGQSKYSFKLMSNLAAESIFEYTTTPLKISGYLAGLFSIASVASFMYVLFEWFNSSTVEGWTSLMCTILISGALLFSVVAIQNYYIGMLTASLYFDKQDEVLSVTRVNPISENKRINE